MKSNGGVIGARDAARQAIHTALFEQGVIPSVSEGTGGEGGAPPAPAGPSLTLGMTEK